LTIDHSLLPARLFIYIPLSNQNQRWEGFEQGTSQKTCQIKLMITELSGEKPEMQSLLCPRFGLYGDFSFLLLSLFESSFFKLFNHFKKEE
jgi:hypothetical protein